MSATSDRTEWLERRRQGIGGSDVAAILGLSPWGSPWSVWADKTGLTPIDDRDNVTDDMEFGTRAEPMLTKWFQDRTGLLVAGEQMELSHPDKPWMKCTADGFVFDNEFDHFSLDNALGIVEHKKTADHADKWAEQIPFHYQCQAQWMLAITGLPVVWFSVLHVPFGRTTYATYRFERDDTDIEHITSTCERFWTDRVLTGTPPPTDGSTATTEALATAWDDTTDEPVELDDAIRRIVADLADVKATIKRLEADKAEAENAIKAALADHETGTADGWKVSWKPQTRSAIDAKALRAEMPDVADKFTRETSSRVLRITPPKES